MKKIIIIAVVVIVTLSGLIKACATKSDYVANSTTTTPTNNLVRDNTIPPEPVVNQVDDDNTDVLLAKTKATIWSSTYKMLKPYFESSTGQNLRSGLSVLVAVSVEFHGVYGFSLNIRDIDPTFTIGEMAARRLKIIRRSVSQH